MSFDRRRIPPPGRAIRLTFSVKGETVELLKTQAVDMTAPPSDELDEAEGRSGLWCELRTDGGDLIYRRSLGHPGVGSLEAPSGDPERPFTRVAVEGREEVFQVLVPEYEERTALVLRGSRGGRNEAAEELGRYDMKRGKGEKGGQ